MPILTCPLTVDWQEHLDKTFLLFKSSTPEEEQHLRTAFKTPRGPKLADIEAAWEIAADDCSQLPPQEGTHFFPGYPRHVHTEFTFEEHLIHVDRIWDESFGPLHGHTQFYIFVNGALEGIGHAGGTSLGVSSAIMPAVAIVTPRTAIVITNNHSRASDDSLSVCAEPDSIAVYAIKYRKRSKTQHRNPRGR